MNIKIEGTASIGTNQITVVCGFCNAHESENALIELNAREKKIFFMCNKCKKMNEIRLGRSPQEEAPPYPKIRLGK